MAWKRENLVQAGDGEVWRGNEECRVCFIGEKGGSNGKVQNNECGKQEEMGLKT